MVDSPALAPSLDEWNDECIVPDELVGRLYRASDKIIHELIAGFSPHQRARLAVFCYRRSHLHDVGLTIAASCDQSTLIQVFGTAIGTILHTQSHDRVVVAPRPPGPHRSKITLARPAFARPRLGIGQDDSGERELAYSV